jgi:hypothetical protein
VTGIVGRVRWTVSCIGVGLTMCCAGAPSPAIAPPQVGPSPSASSDAALAHVDNSHPDSTRHIVEVATARRRRSEFLSEMTSMSGGTQEFMSRSSPRWIRAWWSSIRTYHVSEAGHIAKQARSASSACCVSERDVADVTLKPEARQRWQAIELADAGVEWSTVDSSLRIRWLLGPTSRMQPEELLLRLSPQ